MKRTEWILSMTAEYEDGATIRYYRYNPENPDVSAPHLIMTEIREQVKRGARVKLTTVHMFDDNGAPEGSVL